MNFRKLRGDKMLVFSSTQPEQKRGDPKESLNMLVSRCYCLYQYYSEFNHHKEIIRIRKDSLQRRLHTLHLRFCLISHSIVHYNFHALFSHLLVLCLLDMQLILKMTESQKQTPSKFAFNIDRGGTFTDFYVQQITQGKIVDEFAFKVLSQSFEGEGPIVGIRRFLSGKGLMAKGEKVQVRHISHINLGTTIATNALLERKGCRNAMILTKGFGDLLKIRHQARPNIFDLKCETKPPLSQHTLELNERIYLFDTLEQDLKKQTNGTETVYAREPSQMELREMVAKLKDLEVESVGISLCNSYLYPNHEIKIKRYLEKQGFKFVEIGSNYKDLGYLKRSETASLDAFLNPIMNTYFNKIQEEFDSPDKLLLRIMRSDGGFGKSENVRASQLLLSGPAGGLIGCKSIIPIFEELISTPVNNLICLDMGGTSTDISRIEGKQFSVKYSLDVQGIQICTPHLEIDTIAAGGGSKLRYENGMFVVGPESVGSNPGPACYGIGNNLAVTDANLILNRLDPLYFPKIFGKNKNESLNKQASIRNFERLAEQINEGKEYKKSIYEIAQGFIEIANELMAKSTRKLLTLGIPDALVIFGSAGGQHCCDLAAKIGVRDVFIHRFSGILSAYGLSKAVETKQSKYFLGLTVSKHSFNFEEVSARVEPLKSAYPQGSTAIYEIGVGYEGTSYTIKVPYSPSMIQTFQELHKKQNGFSLKTTKFRLEYFNERIVTMQEQFTKIEKIYEEEDASQYQLKKNQVFISGSFATVPYYDIEHMKNCKISGPALLLSSTSSILIKPGWHAKITPNITHISFQPALQTKINKTVVESSPDPIKLTLYSTRLMSIAEEMGKVLQNISISTNIRERLDFSCGIFDWQGKLLANAPHLPVHLGSMQTAVTQQIKRGIKVGDVVLTNHPAAGGSHLPDLTVVSCSEVQGIRMYLASRGHHADIGGLTPGSMPAFSKSLSEEGVAVEQFHLIKDHEFQEADLRQLFAESRRIQDNVSDLLAQIAANQVGIKLLKRLINEYGVEQFQTYVGFICENAAESVRNLLCKFSIENNLKEVDTLTNTEYMDDGTPITLALTIDRKQRQAVFDFTGTGFEVVGNTNAPRSITRSAILYCLRALIKEEIPLNSGCLRPLSILIPDQSILSPSKQAAVVGGNVETSQKVVDLILKPFQFVACSQGTMNNFLFGNSKCSYYQTICGGSGAGKDFNGTTIQCHMTNTRITDVESLEKTYPVIVREFNQRAGSGGRGKQNGGNGVIREFQFTEEVTMSIISQRRVYHPYGVKGGQPGAVGKNTLIDQNGVRKNIGGKNTIVVKKLERVRIETPGGGGYEAEEK